MLGIVGAAIIGAAMFLWQHIDIRQLVPQLAGPVPTLPAPEPPAAASRDARGFDAVVFSSPRNQAYFPDPAYYRTALDSWSGLIEETGGTVREVVDADGLRRLSESELLVLVEAPCLSAEELDAVEAHLERGGGVLANWAAGVRNGDCEWVGWESVLSLTGAEDVRELPAREALYLTVPEGIALSPGFDPGTRVELLGEPSLALRLEGARVYWSDWALNPEPDESGGGADVGAIATRSPLGGRVAWFGYRVDQAATPADRERLAQLIRNGAAWAAGVPSAVPAPWPRGARAALTFTLDVEAEPENAFFTAAMLEERNLRGTFYVVSQLVLDNAELARALSAAGEVGSQTSDHSPLAGLTSQDQRFRLQRAWSEVEEWTGVAPTGLRPPEETFDANTLEAWRRAGGTYLVGSNEARTASPEIHRAGEEGTLVLLPRILKDDYNVIVQDRVLRSAGLEEALLAGTRKVRAIGGLAVVAGHTQILRPGRRIDALAAVADSVVAQGDWWITNASDIATWWAARAETRIDFDTRPDATGAAQQWVSDIVVTAPARRPIEDLWVDVVIPEVPEGLVPVVDGRSVDFQATEWGMRVPVGYMVDGESRRIAFVVLEDEDADVDGTD
jgi:peptidoglycan/xylan/chitin deacetylase (PgdA/CDA1 family)